MKTCILKINNHGEKFIMRNCDTIEESIAIKKIQLLKIPQFMKARD